MARSWLTPPWRNQQAQYEMLGSMQAFPAISRTRPIFRSTWIPRRKPSMLKAVITAVWVIGWIFLVHMYLIVKPATHTDFEEPVEQIQEDETHHIFRSTNPGPTNRNPMSIRAYDAMSDKCVEQWVVHHQWGPACVNTNLSEGLRVDGVWAWVNGSDPLQISTRQQYQSGKSSNMDAVHRFSERNELLYSMRAAIASLGNDTMQRLHVLASAYHYPNGSADIMAGQMPGWIDKKEALTGKGRVVVHHDAEFFRPMESSESNLSSSDIQDWREAVIPSFNSLAVESQIHNLDHSSSDQLVYYNDDFFTLRRLAVSDFTTPLYGPVIKTLTRITSMYLPAKDTFWRVINAAGEEPGIKRAAWVLGRRFALRPYYYITHHPRTLWLPLLREAAQTFPEAFTNTPLARFRAQKDVPASVQAVFLGSWYVVERHREALLWSWSVAKWGGRGGILSPMLKDRMWIELANESSPSTSYLSIPVPVRMPIGNPNVFGKTNISMPTSTEYSFSSKDGYALSYVDSMWFWNRPRHGYPNLTKGLLQNSTSTGESNNEPEYFRDPGFVAAKACSIARSTCFASSAENETASDFFKRIAFEQPKCGDCIITALINASGLSGIDKFLPHHDAETAPELHTNTQTSPPHLPLTSEWEPTDFSLAHAIPKGSLHTDMTLRTWCTRLIQRYSYVLGAVESDLYKVEWANKLEAKLGDVEREVRQDVQTYSTRQTGLVDATRGDQEFRFGGSKGPLTFLCLNDDIKETGELRDRIGEILSGFFARMWDGRLSFERTD